MEPAAAQEIAALAVAVEIARNHLMSNADRNRFSDPDGYVKALEEWQAADRNLRDAIQNLTEDQLELTQKAPDPSPNPKSQDKPAPELPT